MAEPQYLPSLKEPVTDKDGRFTADWQRYFTHVVIPYLERVNEIEIEGSTVEEAVNWSFSAEMFEQIETLLLNQVHIPTEELLERIEELEVVLLSRSVLRYNTVGANDSFTDHRIIRGDGKDTEIQDSLASIDDSGILTALGGKFGDRGDLDGVVDTDYSEFNGVGVLNMYGLAKVYQHLRIGAMEWHPGASPPADSDIGIVHTIAFDKDSDDEVHYTLICPARMESGSEIGVYVDWAYTGTQDNGTVIWGLEYINLNKGETIDGSTTTRTVTSAGTHATGKLVRTTFGTGIAGAYAHEDIAIRFYRDVDADTLNTDAHLIQVHFMVTVDKIGEPIYSGAMWGANMWGANMWGANMWKQAA